MTEKKPNILFLFSDQQRWDTCGCYGQPLATTPNLDRMAGEGVRFENAFTCQPVCGPARACLQTGRYATELGCHTNNRMLPIGERTIAHHLADHGYDTAYIGKWHLASCGPKGGPDDFKIKAVPPERRGGYNDFWLASDVLEFTSHGYDGHMFDQHGEKREFPAGRYRVDAQTDWVLEYLQTRTGEKPFFLFVSYLEPHHQNDHGHFEGPRGSRQKFKDFVAPGDLVGQDGNWREEYPDYLGCIHSLDENTGRIRQALKETGLADNTLVIYTSDHGSHFCTRNSEYKRACHDGCIRVPLIVNGPGFQGGLCRKEMISLIDLPPTILTAAGITPPATMRGRPVQDLFTDRKTDWPGEVFLQISEDQCGRAIRTPRWKYSVRAPDKSGNDPSSELYMEDFLYDLEADLHEQNNLVDDPGFAGIRDELAQTLKRRMVQAGEAEPQILSAAAIRLAETPDQKNARMAWWREARFGLFIHWGIYAIPAGEWRGLEKHKRLGGEWIMFNARIPVAEYEPLAREFNPVKFDAGDWVRAAREAGMSYIVITAKHCDGFAMFRSKASPYNIVDATPFGRDPMAELKAACDKQDLKLGLYYSHSWDWHEPDAADDPRYCNNWDFLPREQRNTDRYFRGKSLPQVDELLTQYRPALLWFDVPNLSRAWSEAFLGAIRRQMPACMVNNRVGNGLGDYETPEQFIPREKLGGDFEVCMTLNEHWGFAKNDHAWKSPRTVIRFLADIVAKGGNLLLNVGPTAEGVFPPESLRILEEVGRWMRVNGESIHGTQAGPLSRVPWGVCTRASGKLYLHVFEWPANGRLFVPGLRNEVTAAYLLSDRKPLGFVRHGDRDWSVSLPAQSPDADDAVVVLEFQGEPDVDSTQTLLPAGALFYASAAKVHGKTACYLPRSMKRREYDFIGYWTDPREWIEWTVRVAAPGVYEASAVIGAAPICEGNQFAVTVGDRQLECIVHSTGEYEAFKTVKLGAFAIAEPGVTTLSIKPLTIGKGSDLMNLHAVTLKKVSDQSTA